MLNKGNFWGSKFHICVDRSTKNYLHCMHVAEINISLDAAISLGRMPHKHTCMHNYTIAMSHFPYKSDRCSHCSSDNITSYVKERQ